MPPRKRHPEESGATNVEAVRRAVVHLMDVAASYERALAKDSSATLPAPFKKVVTILNDARDDRARAELRGVTAQIVEEVAAIYKAFKKDKTATLEDQREQLREVFSANGFELTDKGLRKLVVNRGTITRRVGPSMCADKTTAAVFRQHWQTIANWRKGQGAPLLPTVDTIRTGRFGLVGYALALLGWSKEEGRNAVDAWMRSRRTKAAPAP